MTACASVTGAVRNRPGSSGPSPEEAAGLELRRLRTARGWSQEDVARRMAGYGYDWHQTMIAKTEAAERPLRLNELTAMCDLFGVALADLLGAVPGMTARELEGQAAARAARLEGRIARARDALDGG